MRRHENRINQVNRETALRLDSERLERLLAARCVLVLTGAGMSAESGIPTFREAQTGLWARYRPEELATPEAFRENPARVWQWYEERRRTVRASAPHAGHRALVELANLLGSVHVVTQNVDGLHQAAGSKDVVELHGNINRSKCSVTHRPISREWLKDQDGAPPPSPYVARGLARPDVVWFGEVLPQAAIDRATALAGAADFCFSIGTTSLVQPAAGLPLIAQHAGATLVEINPAETPLSLQADQCLRGAAAAALTAIRDQVRAALSD
jgi:NAD-dependent deacetylase